MAHIQYRICNPQSKSNEMEACNSQSEVRRKAEVALAELRGKKLARQTAEGFEILETGWNLKALKNLRCVPFLIKKSNEVRWCDLSNDPVNGAGALSIVIQMLDGDIRLADEEEEETAIEKLHKDLKTAETAKEAFIAGPVEKAVERVLSIMDNVSKAEGNKKQKAQPVGA